MSLIAPVTKDDAPAEVKEKLEGIEHEFGMIPNGVAVMAHSNCSLDMFLKMQGSLAEGELNETQREMIALAVSQANECRYCVSAHTEFCSGLGLDTADIIKSRLCEADNAKDQAMLDLAVAIVENKGGDVEDQINNARDNGLTDGQIIEVVSNVINIILGNYVNKLAETEIDFPVCKMDL